MAKTKNRSRLWKLALVACLIAVAMTGLVRGAPPQASQKPRPVKQPQQPPQPQPTPQATEEPAKQINPLAAKQEMIRDRFQRFQDRVFSLREQLSQSEPENAARLARALQRAGELGLSDKLEEIISLLNDPAMLHKAVDEEDAFLASAERLLELLLAQSGDEEQRRKEIERLKEYKEQVERLLKEQRGLRSEAGQAADAQRMKDQLDQAIRRVDELQKRQAALSDATQKAAGDTALNRPTADAQRDLSRDTSQLSDDLKQLAEPPGDQSADSPPMQQARSLTDEASKSSKSGAQSMSQAGESVQQGDNSRASQQQKQASQALQETRQQLQAARNAMEKQPDGSESTEKQQSLADQTQGLSDKMKQDAAGGQQSGQQGGKQGGKQGGQQGGQSSQGSSQSPGQPNVQQAQQQMEKAAQSLGQKSPGDATPKQDKAIEQLDQARQELEKSLEELRKEERAETLRDLESRLRDMLAKQKPINDETIKLDQLGEAGFRRAEQLQLAELSTRQRGLSEQAATCLHILDEDATTIAFPHVLGQLVDDMAASADRLAAFHVGAITQTIQAEIVDALEQLLEAVQRMEQENQDQNGQPSQSAAGPQPLLPPSAELKLLRSSQLRINNRTGVVAESVNKGVEAKDAAGLALTKLAARQAECADIARQIREKEQEQQ